MAKKDALKSEVEMLNFISKNREKYLHYSNVLSRQLVKITANPDFDSDKEFEEFSQLIWNIVRLMKKLYFLDKKANLN